MALTKTQVSSLYVAIFNRASEGEGNTYWQNTGMSMEETANAMLATTDAQEYFGSSLDSDQAFIEHIYANTLNKTLEDDPAGIAYWVARLEAGESRGDVVTALVNAVYDYADSTDPVTKAAYDQFVNRVEVSDYMADTVPAAPADYKTSTSFSDGLQVTADPATVVDAIYSVNEIADSQTIDSSITNVLTLKKVVDETVTVSTETDTTTYWGDASGNKITMDQFYEMVRTVTGQDLFELTDSAIDIGGDVALTDVNISSNDNDSDAGGDASITYTTATGEQFTTELALAQEYIDLLDSLIYYTDADGNKVSRFSTESTESTTTSTSYDLTPVVLTTTVNNGATFEEGFTTSDNDLIVAGETELLHGAYIDGGAGINTLEVSMKGVYAQPVQLLNIQNINVENLPNVYTDYYNLDADNNADGYEIPDYLDLTTATSNAAIAADALVDAQAAQAAAQDAYNAAIDALDTALSENESNDNGTDADQDDISASETLTTLRDQVDATYAALQDANAALSEATNAANLADNIVVQANNLVNAKSILDLSNARDLENLTITEGIKTSDNQDIGDLTIVGVRGNATTTLEGSFTADHVNVYYSEGLEDGVNLTLNLGNVGSTEFNIFHNSNTININSIGGGNVLNNANFGNASLLNMNISGNAEFYVNESIADTFYAGHPADINASQNTGGVDINMSGFDDEVVFTGTAEADDHLTVLGDLTKSVTVTDGNGDNEFQLKAGTISIVSGNGNNEIVAESTVTDTTITTGSGSDVIKATSARNLTVDAGDGVNEITAEAVKDANITSGEGNDIIALTAATTATIDAGNGDNVIEAAASKTLSITTGTGNDKIEATATETLTIDAGEGNNTVVANAANLDITAGEGNDTITITGTTTVGTAVNASKINIDLGAGEDTIHLGDQGYGITALSGSSISGENITLVVDEASDLSQASLSGVTSVVLDSDKNLTLSAEQFIAIGAENFSVDGVAFGNTATLTLVVTDSMNFDDLGITGDTFACDDINLNIVLACAGKDENVLTITAEQLDTYIAEDGIRVDYDNGYDNNQVVVTDASLAFDAFATGVGSIDDQTGKDDVTVVRDVNGYSRPTEDGYLDYMNIDTDVDTIPAAIGDDATLLDTLNIKGSQDITTTVNLGENFTIDFSELTGTANLTVADFADMTTGTDTTLWGSITGNGTTENPARVNVELNDDDTVGSATQGITVSGVQTLMATNIDGSSTVYLCDTSADIKTVGLQGNWGDTVTYKNLAWDVDVLLEAALTAKTDTYDVGAIVVDYFTDTIRGTLAQDVVVDINNGGEAVENGIWVQSITVNGAEDLTINAADGSVQVNALTAPGVNNLTVTGTDDVTIKFADAHFADDFNKLDATGVAGTFTLDLVGDTDLSNVDESGIDAITFEGDTVALTLNVDQAIELGSVIVDNDTTTTTLNVTGLSDEALDLSTIDVDNIGTVTTADVDGTIVLNEATNLGDADTLIITALDSDTTLQMTVDQFHTYCGETTEAGTSVVGCNVNGSNEATLKLTGATGESSIDLTNVDQVEDAATPGLDAVDVTIVLDNVVATKDMEIIGTANSKATLEISGDTDITLLNETTTGTAATIVDVNFTSDATLTLTADQIVAIEAAYDAENPGSTESAFSVAEGANVTVNVVDLTTQALDLDALADAGINIGTVSIENIDAAIALDPATTFGGADEIITPTADTDAPEYGTESTSVSMTVAQFESSAGVITGDSQINLTGLVNNKDTDGDYRADHAEYDFSNIENAGTIEFADTATAETVTLTDTANLGGFDIKLYSGDMIQFATEKQASGTKVFEDADTSVTAVAWLFDTTTAVIDTTNYDSSIDTLYVNEDLVDGVNVEALWNTLPSTITVEVVNSSDIPDVLVGFDRTVTVDAMTGLDGMTFDDQAEYQTIQNLTINLEGNTSVGNIVIDDTVGEGTFQQLVINSYEDRTTLENDNGFTFQPNKVGDISLSETPSNELVDVVINTYGDDADNTSGTQDDKYSEAATVENAGGLRDGLAVEVGTIKFASTSGDHDTATLTLTGAEDITIANVEFSDPDLTMLHIANNNIATVEIGGSEVTTTNVYMLDNYVSDANDVYTFADNSAIEVVNGTVDLTNDTIGTGVTVKMDADTTLTMTAAQVATIGFADADGDGVADAWSGLAGATLNIVDLGDGANLDLDKVAAAGIDIGTITTQVDTNVTLADTMTMGGADEVIVSLQNADTTLTMTAQQYSELKDGKVTESDSDATNVNKANVTITDLITIATDTNSDNTPDTVLVDFSTVTTTGAHRVELADAGTAADLTMDAATNLSDFAVVLDSQGTQLNDLAGQTVRFNTAVQAERTIDVINDDGADDNGTNVVWLFNTIDGTETSGKVDTSNYDANLGRVWMLESLVDGENVEELYTSLAGAIIIRVVNEDDLTTVLPAVQGFDRHMEIESYTNIGDLTFSDIDDAATQPFDFVENLTLDLGGNVSMGDIEVSNILAAPISNNDQFDTLTINSYMAADGSGAEYLLPEGYDYGDQPGEVPYPDAGNVVGDIAAGSDDFELRNVTINTDNPTTGSADLTVGTITFTDDGEDANGNPEATPVDATLTLTGGGDVTIEAIDTTDADIGALIIDTTGFTGTLDPVMHMDNTEDLTIANDNATTGTVSLEEVEGNELSTVNAADFDGTLSITLSQIDSNNDDRNNDGDTTDAGDAAFTYTAGAGKETVVVKAMNGNTPTLEADSTWNFDFTGTDDESTLTLDGSISLADGSNLSITNVPKLIITNDLDLTKVNLTITGTELEVAAGDTLTLTAAQADGLTIKGAGDVVITKLEDKLDADLSGIMTNSGDTGSVEVTVDTADNDDADTDAQDLVFTGNVGVAHTTVSGGGSLDVTAATVVPVDRNETATAADFSDDTIPSFTVETGTLLTLGANQVGVTTGVTTADWKMSVDGAGEAHVANLQVNAAADLSGLATNTITANTDTVLFTGNLGHAVTTVNDGETMTTTYSIATGHTINEVAAPTGTGALVVTLNLDAANGIDESAADLSTITSDMDASQITANFIADMTFTGNLDGHSATVGTSGSDVDVVASADIVDGLTITTADTDNSIHIPDLADYLAADLSGITGTGDETAAFDADGTFTGDLGTVTVTIADGVSMTASVAKLINKDVNKVADGAVVVTMANADANYDADNADGDSDTTTGTFEELDYDLNDIVGGATGTAADITSITVLDDLTFRGTLHDTVATGVADGATLSTTAEIADDKFINMTGTTGAANIDMSADADRTLKGSADFTVTGLVSALTATDVSGNLDVTVADDAAMSVDLGTGTNTVDADALSSGNALSLDGDDRSVTAHTVNGDIDASAIGDADGDSTTGGATLSGADGQNDIKGTANDDIINGGIDQDTLAGGAGDDTYIYDATLDIVAGETITDNNGTEDTIEVRTSNALDLSLINNGNSLEVDILDLNTTVGASDVDVTISGTQLADIQIVDANEDDTVTVDDLNGVTVDATDAEDTFVFASGDTGIDISAWHGDDANTNDLDYLDFSNMSGDLAGANDIGRYANSGALSTYSSEEYKIIIFDEAAAADWSDLLTLLNAGIDYDANDDDGTTSDASIILVDNGTDTRIYLLGEDGQGATNNDIDNEELTLIGTLHNATAGNNMADNIIV